MRKARHPNRTAPLGLVKIFHCKTQGYINTRTARIDSTLG
jgi:hypothetical protein